MTTQTTTPTPAKTRKPRTLDLSDGVPVMPDPLPAAPKFDPWSGGGSGQKDAKRSAGKQAAKAVKAALPAPVELPPLTGASIGHMGGGGSFSCIFHPDHEAVWHNTGFANRPPKDGLEALSAIGATSDIALENLKCADGTVTDAHAVRQIDANGKLFGPAFQARVSGSWGGASRTEKPLPLAHKNVCVPPAEIAAGLIPWGFVLTEGGGLCVAQYKLGEIKVKGDGSRLDALLSLGSNYLGRANRGGFIGERAVCSNTAMHVFLKCDLVLTHHKNAADQLDAWREAIVEGAKRQKEFETVANRLNAHKLREKDIDDLIEKLFPCYPVDITTPALATRYGLDFDGETIIDGVKVLTYGGHPLTADTETVVKRVEREREEFRVHVFEKQPGLDLYESKKTAWAVLQGAASYDLRMRKVRTSAKKGEASQEAEAEMRRAVKIAMDYEATYAAQASQYLYQVVGIAA